MWRILACCLITGIAAGQEGRSAPRFEVATIKISNSSSQDSTGDISNGRLYLKNVPLRFLIAEAWTTDLDRVKGPSWLDEVRVDVVAKASSPQTPDTEIRQMLQTLLKERMKLVLHTENREQRAWILSVPRGQSKMTASEMPSKPEDVDCSLKRSPTITRLACKRITMPILANKLRQVAGRDLGGIVVDETGLTGAWDFMLEWSPADEIEKQDGPTLFSAVQTQLGLQLLSRKMPIPVIVVDNIDRTPAEN